MTFPFFSLRRIARSLATRCLFVAVLVALAMTLFASRAEAQQITVFQEQSLPRISVEGKVIGKRALNLEPEGVSFQDCIEDQRIRFPLQLSQPVGQASFEAWAGLGGADCKVQQNRTGINSTCWQLVTGIPLQTNPVVDIPVRTIMAGAPPFKPAEIGKGEDMCGRVDLATISIQFLYFAPGQLATPASHKDLQVKVDTVGPSPPTGLKTLPGNTRIQVQWDNISGEAGLSVLTGVKVYCDPAQATSTTTTTDAAVEDAEPVCTTVPIDASDDSADAGFTDGGCTSGTSTTPPASTNACASPNFVDSDGKPLQPTAEFNSKYECGAITGNTGASARAEKIGDTPLTNGTTYAVAVAATDAFGNVGPLSSVICERPAETTDFWESYKSAGGDSGGGFCTTSGPGLPVGSLSVLGVAGLLVLSALRRRGAKGQDR